MNRARGFELPPERQDDMRRAKRLEWLTIGYLLSVIILMYLVMGASQAMRTAWIEDILSLVPPIGFLIAARIRYRPPDEQYPYGYHRSINIAYFMSAMALLAMGVYLIIDAAIKLFEAKHPTIGTTEIYGHSIWLGWLMLLVLVWATVPAVFLGHSKISIAKRLHDKPLFADAEMNKADWMTGLAAAMGILGIGGGWWWADAVAAGVISLSVIKDGAANLRAVVGDLMDRAPKTVDHTQFLELPTKIAHTLQTLGWVEGAEVRLREQGHVLFCDVCIRVNDERKLPDRRDEIIRRVTSLDWRLHEVSVQFVK